MKKIVFLFLAFSFFIGCSGDDDNNEPNPISIIGKWKLTKVTSQMTTSNVYAVGEGTDYNAFMTFEENPNKVTSEGEVTLEVKVYMDGILIETMYQTLNFDNQFGSGQWSISGSDLTLSGPDSDVNVTIFESTQNTLKFIYIPNSTNEVNFEFVRVN